MDGVKILGSTIVVHTTIGPFKLIEGQWRDGVNQPAPHGILRYLNEEHERQSRIPVSKLYGRIPVDKGDSL